MIKKFCANLISSEIQNAAVVKDVGSLPCDSGKAFKYPAIAAVAGFLYPCEYVFLRR